MFLSTEELEGSVLGVFLESVLASDSSHLPPHFGQYLPLSRPCPGFRDGWGISPAMKVLGVQSGIAGKQEMYVQVLEQAIS